jgi:hypothetical protein
MYCKRLKRSTLTLSEPETCPDKQHSEREHKPRMAQVPFVAICAHGRLDDFPFDKWVHRAHQPSCQGPLRLVSRGGGLEGQVVKCDGCGMDRSLSGIFEAQPGEDGTERTNPTDRLAPGAPYYCPGARPWLAESAGPCGQPIRGALRGAGNVYFPKVESSQHPPVVVARNLHAPALACLRADVRAELVLQRQIAQQLRPHQQPLRGVIVVIAPFDHYPLPSVSSHDWPPYTACRRTAITASSRSCTARCALRRSARAATTSSDSASGTTPDPPHTGQPMKSVPLRVPCLPFSRAVTVGSVVPIRTAKATALLVWNAVASG